jgi:hypothetical protein
MNSRKFLTKAFLQAHDTVLKEFLSRSDDPAEIGIDTANDLADLCSVLANRLCVHWEASLRLTQLNDDNPESTSGRVNSVIDLARPFSPPPRTCPDCGGNHTDHDDHDEVALPATSFSPFAQNNNNRVH